jgi:hypothetical protein
LRFVFEFGMAVSMKLSPCEHYAVAPLSKPIDGNSSTAAKSNSI